MSKLEELIQKYCPDGVEWKPFSDVCDYIRGITFNKEQEVRTHTENAHKVLRANNITLKLNALNFDEVKLVSKDVVVKPSQYLYAGDILMCAGSGSKEHVGKVAFITDNMDYTFGGFMGVIRCKQNILPKYMFHILTSSSFANHLDEQINSSTINNINKQVMQAFVFPVPPIPIQEEVIRLLDVFAELHTEQQDNLEAELKKRQQQYKYYRDKLFSFEGRTDIKWKKFGDLCSLITKQTGFDYSNSIKDSLTKEMKPGHMPYIQTKFFSGKDFDFNTDYYIPDEIAYRFPKIVLDTKCILLSIVGASIGNIGLYDYPIKSFLGGAIGIARIQPQVNAEFIFHYLTSQAGQDQIFHKVKGAGQATITIEDIREFLIPQPSQSEQQEIVSTIDRLELPASNLIRCLSFEIEKRRQQYEYYRDKLLTFKRKES